MVLELDGLPEQPDCGDDAGPVRPPRRAADGLRELATLGYRHRATPEVTELRERIKETINA
ncbi:hypothetical protein [Streptomyces hesseae]|uniref:Uncharacterized protein n=1 Tax=Streptomyces hesseae TaxID=3075519 RepID=A0ABU2SKS6_9ACTN|nr:hypothetical protein [Streptomyces sp. DSM 40473]MDT0449578.1 hypothetical protein [Streptomyces sp. DSM 40473]